MNEWIYCDVNFQTSSICSKILTAWLLSSWYQMIARWVNVKVKFVSKRILTITPTTILTYPARRLDLVSNVAIFCTLCHKWVDYSSWFLDVTKWKLNYCWIFKDDAYWWQARKEVDKTTRAGLIPSRSLQERRIIHERNQTVKDSSSAESKSKIFPLIPPHSFPILIHHITSFINLTKLTRLMHTNMHLEISDPK